MQKFPGSAAAGAAGHFQALLGWYRPWIQHPKFGLIVNFHIPRVYDFDFMVTINLRIYKGFDREIAWLSVALSRYSLSNPLSFFKLFILIKSKLGTLSLKD